MFCKESEEYNETNCIKFALNVKCELKEKYKNKDRSVIDALPVEEAYTNTTGYIFLKKLNLNLNINFWI